MASHHKMLKMKNLLFLFLFAPLVLFSQSLLDADSIIVIQNNDSTFTALAVTIYPGLKAGVIKQVYRDRYDKSQRLKVEAAKLTIQLNEKANKASTTFFQVTGDTISLDSVSLDGEWALKGGEISINFTVTNNNQSDNNKVALKVVDAQEILLIIKDVGEVSFYKENENSWIGKGKELFKMTRRRAKEKAKQ